MSILKISAMVIFVGSIAFLIAAFSPISRVYGLSRAEDKLAMIKGDPGAWKISQTLFSFGAIITAVGIALAAYVLRDRSSASLLYVGATFLVIGAAVWTWHVYLRTADPASFVNGLLPGWHFALYSLLTMAAFLLIGIALPRMGFSAWGGWLLLGGALLFSILYIIFRDMPPFVHYLLGLVFAFALFRGR
jgi:hypothetical protein